MRNLLSWDVHNEYSELVRGGDFAGEEYQYALVVRDEGGEGCLLLFMFTCYGMSNRTRMQENYNGNIWDG